MIDGGFNNSLERKPFGFNSIYRNSELTNGDKFGRRPVAGIKNIEVQYKGGFKAIRECTVSWVVPSLDDLEMFNDHFFTVGTTVIVDWGWVYSDGNVDTKLANSFITRNAPTGGRPSFEVKQEIFTNPQRIISTMDGDYDAIGGQITNFEISLRSDGGFDCTTKIISMGASLFKRPLDVGGNQAGIKVRGKDARTTPPDSLVNCVLNLEPIIFKSVFKIEEVDKLYATNWIENLTEVKRNSTIRDTMTEKAFSEDLEDYRLSNSEKKYVFLVDDKRSPQVLWVSKKEMSSVPSTSEIFVTWGWMEDNIISRYTSFVGGSGADRDVKMTMRSLDTVFHTEGEKIGQPIVLSGELDKAIAEKYDIDIKDDGLIDGFGKELRVPTKIRKPPFLLPVNPFRFFTSNVPKRYIAGVGGKTGFLQRFYDSFFTIGDFENFKKFSDEGNDARFGSLRHIWVNIKEIQKAFGIGNAKSKDTSTSNINPPGTLDIGINNLLTNLNANFHNVWDFEVIVDPFNTTNIKVVDKSDSEIENPQYTQYLENSHKVQNNGVFQFPSFKRGSMVKNQTLNFKIPDAQALTILYGRNKKDGDTEQEFINGQLQKLFEIKKDRKKDKFLADLESSKYSSKGDSESLQTNIGSYKANPNSKISFGERFGIEINPKSWENWWKIWKPDIEEGEEDPTSEDSKPLWGLFKQGYYDVQEDEKTKKPKVVIIKGGAFSGVKTFYKRDSTTSEAILEPNVQKVLNSYMNSSSPIAQFDMSNLIPAELGLEIDGTGGITPFDVVHTEYIQGIYKSDIKVENFVMTDKEVVDANRRAAGDDASYMEADGYDFSKRTEDQKATEETPIGPLTFFQIKDVKHTLDESGWKTEITSVMRINRIQRFDKITGLDVQSGKIERTIQKTHSDITGSNYIPSDRERGTVEYYRGEAPEFEERVVDAPKIGMIEKEIEKVQETSPPLEDNAFILPGQIIGDRRVNTDPDLNRQAAENIRNSGRPVYNFDYTPYDFSKEKTDAPPIKKSAPLAKAYDRKLELRKMPFTDLPIPEKVEQREIPETKTYTSVQPKQQVDLREYGTVKQVKGSTFTDMRFAKLNEKQWVNPVVETQKVNEEIVKAKLSEVINNPLPVVEEIVILKSTYNPSWPDWATNPTFKLIYKIVPGWYTKSTNNPKNTSFYGEPPTSAVAKRFRQKFWDEVIEMPNDTGTTALDNTAAINAKLAEIGDTYKDLGPYDTWKPITGLDYARYNPTTGKADYTENGVKIVLLKGTN
jgi:hypothetical protein